MIIFIGDTRKKTFVEELQARRIGRILQRDTINVGLNSLYYGERWAFDNGAFSDWNNGIETFDADKWKKAVEIVKRRTARPYFAVLPDLPAQGLESLNLSRSWAEWPPANWSWYLAVQDGQSHKAVHQLVTDCPSIRGVFLGGTTEFKRNHAPSWADFAHTHGLAFHYGRASTPRIMRHAKSIGADSCDTSFPLWEQQRFQEFLDCYDCGYTSSQLQLFR
jgi:hypothetical protein